MSLFRKRAEVRDLTIPWNTSAAYGPSTRVTQDRALHLVPVLAAVRHVVDFGSTLPLDSFRKDGDRRIPMPLPRLFGDLEKRGLLVSWLGTGLMSLAARGNAVGLMTSVDGFGFPTQITWIAMDRVYVDDSSGVGRWFIDGRPVPATDIVHVPWITVPGRTLALSPIEYAASTINAGLDSQTYGNDWFKGGGFPPAVFKNNQKTVSPEESSKIRQRLSSSMRRREPLVTGNDWDFTPITIPPEQAQFIETQKLSANQVAAIYGIDPTEIGGEAANSLTYSTEELRQINRAANMRPYLSRFERAFASWLPQPQFVKFQTDATIRTDVKTRTEVVGAQLQDGRMSVNEARALEDRSPVPGGDFYNVPAPTAEPNTRTGDPS